MTSDTAATDTAIPDIEELEALIVIQAVSAMLVEV
jgi:hypothetical protein